MGSRSWPATPLPTPMLPAPKQKHKSRSNGRKAVKTTKDEDDYRAVTLTEYSLSSDEISDICKTIIQNKLKLLALNNCPMDDADYRRLIACCGYCKSLVQIYLNFGVLTKNIKRIEWLADSLGVNTQLSFLSLHGTHLGDSGMKLIYNALSYHPSLIGLDLSYCGLGDNSIRLICGLIQEGGSRKGFEHLNLGGNPSVTHRAWSNLAMAVATNRTLKALYLYQNSIGDNVGCMLAVSCTSCRCLVVLDLEATEITDKTAQAFTDARSFPSELNDLNLRGNNLKPHSLEKIYGEMPEGELRYYKKNKQLYRKFFEADMVVQKYEPPYYWPTAEWLNMPPHTPEDLEIDLSDDESVVSSEASVGTLYSSRNGDRASTASWRLLRVDDRPFLQRLVIKR